MEVEPTASEPPFYTTYWWPPTNMTENSTVMLQVLFTIMYEIILVITIRPYVSDVDEVMLI